MQPADILAHEAAPAPAPKGAPRPWWEGRPFVAAMILLAFVPLLYPPIPPLVDLGGHMGRYKVALDLASSPYLSQWYDYHWRPIGNLGVDLLVNPLAYLIGLEPAVKLVVMLIPPMTVAGMLWVAREVHNRLPPTVAFALPLAFGHPFLFGFVNFALSMAFAMLAFGLWLRLGRLGKSKLRAALFVPISIVVFFTHAFGWGALGLMCFSAEAVRQHDRGLSWWKAGFRAAYHASAMALPVIFMVLWRSEASGGRTLDYFDWARKGEYLLRIFRDHWRDWDVVCAVVVYAVPLFAIIHRKLTLSRNLFFSALVMAVCFALLPRVIFGSAYADMRLVPYMAAILILAIRFKGDTDLRLGQWLAVSGVVFLVARLATTTAGFAIQSDHQQAQLGAVAHIERGSRVVALVNAECRGWSMRRSDHLPSLALVRRDAFVNDQWPLAGSSLLTVHYREAGRYAMDPSQVVRLNFCPREGQSIKHAMTHIPRDAFDYLWLLDFRPVPRAWATGWTPVWAGEGSLLLKRSDLVGEAPPPTTRRTEAATAR
ncbi:hypothetical protein H9L12_11140 [Sphingomonas rhizophila]|uniref:Glycosyltransferase RgtA/B/C/D-like domain-containing protein n=1 Tax=Sphingomonas rhizophila TaxID=2071607 RepID=A0A7G9SAB8_9SPHN|nr:hypothetical protein [Sphingomonas rhizophila]QNN64793.1 hypothetical protein H9L12_11140 [Sphingomonas rhizophila]